MTLYFVLTHRHGNRLDSICIQIKATEIHTKDESKHCVNEMTVATRSHPFHLFSFFFRFSFVFLWTNCHFHISGHVKLLFPEILFLLLNTWAVNLVLKIGFI